MVVKIEIDTCAGKIELRLLDDGSSELICHKDFFTNVNGPEGNNKSLAFSPDDTQRFIEANSVLALARLAATSPSTLNNLIQRTINNTSMF
jgi:hypothetical protein